MSLQVIIQHHPSRTRYLDLLLHFLDYENPLVITDNISSVSGVRKCFSNIKDNYALILQDDILPCQDLYKTCEELIKLKPFSLISLFSANEIISMAIHRKRHFVKIDRIYGLCAYIIPKFMALKYLEFEKNIKDDIRADDVRLSMLLKEYQGTFDCYLTAPSLVEHIAFQDSKQRLESDRISRNNILSYRIADYFIGFEESGLAIDWTRNLDNPIIHNIGQKYDFVRHTLNPSY
jgi:hypothetical protein